MFKFIKDMFKKEEPILEISLDNIDEWFDQESSPIKDKLIQDTKDLKLKLYEQIEKANQNINVLEYAELRNKNIQMRAKHFMHGNRLTYIKAMRNFLSQINIGNDHESMLEFSKTFDKDLEILNKTTNRAYGILQEFFANESRNIAINIKNMDSITKEMKKVLEESKILKIKLIKEMISSLKKRIDFDKNTSNSLIEKKNNKEELIYKKNKLETIRNEFKTSEEFDEFKGLKAFAEKIKKQISEHSSKLTNSFSTLERSMKKFARQIYEHEDIVASYQEDATKALLDDKELIILQVLDKLRIAVLKGTVELKDKKKEKTLEEIENLDKNYFSEFISTHQELLSRQKEIHEKLSKSNVEDKLNDLQIKVDKVQLDVETFNNEIQDISSELEKTKIEELKQNLEENIKNFSGTELRIVL
jgi:hypothetical protein